MALPKILVDAEIIEQKALMTGVYLMTLYSPKIANMAKPGNFAQVQTPNTLLRRPLGIANAEDDKISFIYRKIGKGTEELSKLKMIMGFGTLF